MNATKQGKWAHIPVWVRITLMIFALDVASFYIVALFIGGDAARGYYRNGKYYLADHYGAVEVSKSVYYYSNLHLLSIGVVLFFVWLGLKKTPNRPISADSK